MWSMDRGSTTARKWNWKSGTSKCSARFPCEIMVNAADLLLVREARQLALSACADARSWPNGFSTNEPLPAVFAAVAMKQFRVVQLFDDLTKLARLRGEIKKQIFFATAHCRKNLIFVQFLISRSVGQIAGAIKQFAENSCQTFSSTGFVRENWSSAARNSERHDSSVLSRRANPMTAKRRRHLFFFAKMVKRGNQFARSQVAARTKR